jgi:hypothetical protein
MAGRNSSACASLSPVLRAAYQPAKPAHHRVGEQQRRARQRIDAAGQHQLERPHWMLAIAESIACMPEAQLRITVQPGTLLPQPRRSATTRPMLTSSARGWRSRG